MNPWLERLGLDVNITGAESPAGPEPGWPQAVQEVAQGYADRSVPLGSGGSVTFARPRPSRRDAEGRPTWYVGVDLAGDALLVDGAGVLYREDEMGGELERLADDLDVWIAWELRDRARARPTPPWPDGISERLRAALTDQPEPGRYGAATEDDLGVLLEQVAEPASAALLAVEARFGGLVSRWLRAGPFQMLRDPDQFQRRGVDTERGRAVLVGAMPNCLLFLDEAGAVWRRRGHAEHEVPERVARDLGGWLERVALVHDMCEQSALCLRLQGAGIEQLRAALGAELVGDEAGHRVCRGEGALLLEGADPFDASGRHDVSVYVARTEDARAVLERLAPSVAVRLASAPWPSTFEPVPTCPVSGPIPPAGLGTMRRRRSPVVAREAVASLPPLGDGRPLLARWPAEHGAIVLTADGIEQQRAVEGQVVLVQRFSDDEEHQQVAGGEEAGYRDLRWVFPAARLEHLGAAAVSAEAEHGGYRWRHGKREGWIGIGASAAFGYAPRVYDGARLTPLGEEHHSQLFLDAEGEVWRALYRGHPALWHRGHRPTPVAPSVADYLRQLRR